jgi:hypothetical protein
VSYLIAEGFDIILVELTESLHHLYFIDSKGDFFQFFIKIYSLYEGEGIHSDNSD